jgi:hypothetical protein
MAGFMPAIRVFQATWIDVLARAGRAGRMLSTADNEFLFPTLAPGMNHNGSSPH